MAIATMTISDNPVFFLNIYICFFETDEVVYADVYLVVYKTQKMCFQSIMMTEPTHVNHKNTIKESYQQQPLVL